MSELNSQEERAAFKAIFNTYSSQKGFGISCRFYTDKADDNALVIHKKTKPLDDTGYKNFPKIYMNDPIHGETVIGAVNRYKLKDGEYELVETDGIILGEEPSKIGLTFRDHC